MKVSKKFLISSLSSLVVISPISTVLACGVKHKSQKIIIQYPQTIQELKKKYPEYYSSLDDNLKGQELFNALNEIQKTYRTKIGSYRDLWSTYVTSFRDKYDKKDNTLYDIYSEIIGKKDDFEFQVPHRFHATFPFFELLKTLIIWCYNPQYQ